MNPCPNGCDIDRYGQCKCSSEQLRRYRNKISAPLLDRIDLQVSVPKLPTHILFDDKFTSREIFEDAKNQAHNAYKIQIKRQGKLNSVVSGNEIQRLCLLTDEVKDEFLSMLDKLNISARAFHSILKVARTIADLEKATSVEKQHLTESLSYRQFDRLMKI